LGGLLSLITEIDPGELKGKQAWTFNPQDLVTGRTEAQHLVESALQVAGIVLARTEIPSATDTEDLTSRMKQVGRSLARH
jgi:hypothetical protein